MFNLRKLSKMSFSSKNKPSFDPYLILDINRKAPWPDIKKQYYKLARLYHPDVAKNDERTKQKFLQIKEAFEFFERKYNPAKYTNTKQNPKFTFEENENKDNNEKEDNETEESDSIRKNEKRSGTAKIHENQSNDYTTHSNESEDYFTKERLELDIKQQERISNFLKNKIPVPRSDRMTDRLKISEMTIKKGKLLGAEDYLSFLGITFLIMYFLLIHSKESTLNFDDLQKNNLYYSLKDNSNDMDDLVYEDHQETPLEKKISETKDYQDFIKKLNKENKVDQKKMIEKLSITDNVIRDIPKFDIKAEYYKNI
jgi:curved DNA-binding protein CbpA